MPQHFPYHSNLKIKDKKKNELQSLLRVYEKKGKIFNDADYMTHRV